MRSRPAIRFKVIVVSLRNRSAFSVALSPQGQQDIPVRVIPNNELPPVAMIHHVIKASWIFDPDFPRLDPNHVQTRDPCQSVGLTPLLPRLGDAFWEELMSVPRSAH